MSIGRRIFGLREREGMTRRAFAEKIGTSVDDLEAMETGRMGAEGIQEALKREFGVASDFFDVDAPGNDNQSGAE